jgi:hypothetical protein
MNFEADPVAYVATVAAYAVSAGAFLLIAFELWTWRRKSGRKRFALSVVQAEYDSEVISDDFATEFNIFIAHNRDVDLHVAQRLRSDLERIAMVAIGDDLIIDRTAETVRQQIFTLRASQDALVRFRELTDSWVMSGDFPSFLTILPSRIDPLRGVYEFRKKRLILFRKIHQAATVSQMDLASW